MKRIAGFFKSIYLHLRLWLQPLFGFIYSVLRILNGLLSFGVVGMLVYGFGFNPDLDYSQISPYVYYFFILFLAEFIIAFVEELLDKKLQKTWYLKIVACVCLLFVLVVNSLPETILSKYRLLHWFSNNYILFSIVVLQSLVSISTLITRSLNKRLNPNVIFVGSFLILVFAGTGLLLLPKATYQPISFVDALFTAVSAVCVTGLTSVDVATMFTPLGKTIIALLIQLGGIGIMTFTSFFGLFFAGKYIGQNKLFIKDLIDPEKGSSQIFKTLWYIILVTLFFELLGAYFIFLSINGHTLNDVAFALFHSISAFCNAGFSSVSNGLMNELYVGNYLLHFIISILVIVGGLGFPIIFNLIRISFHVFRNFLRKIFGLQKSYNHIPHLMASNTLIVLVVTTILLIGGTLFFYVSEYDNLLSDHSEIGKVVTAFFMAVTPRTAGFSTFDVARLMPVSLFLMIILIWIGASPMSTGGGVKTTTIGVAFLNVFNTLRGRNHIEIRNRRISEMTVKKAFIIIFMSLLVSTVGVLLLIAFEPDIPFECLLFEAVSAVSTAGLSMNITPLLCQKSQLVLIVLMFVGRVGLISILSCMIPTKRFLNYQYPSESIPIN